MTAKQLTSKIQKMIDSDSTIEEISEVMQSSGFSCDWVNDGVMIEGKYFAYFL